MQATEHQKERDCNKIQELKEQLRLSETARAKVEAEVSELKAINDDKNKYIEWIFVRFLYFRDKIIKELVKARVSIAREFRAYPSGRFNSELSYNKAGLDGFTNRLGQLIYHNVLWKEFIPKGLVLNLPRTLMVPSLSQMV